jgi:hypothetical protein
LNDKAVAAGSQDGNRLQWLGDLVEFQIDEIASGAKAPSQ